MAGDSIANGVANGHADVAKETKSSTKNSYAVKVGLAQMLKGGVIMDVVDAEQARIAEEAGAVAGKLPSKPKLCYPH
jgi:pyridoxal 5'-phosphate synthase pdxS subunit